MRKQYLHKDYTLNRSYYQLKVPIELDFQIPKNASVRLLSQLIEEMDLAGLYGTYSRINEKRATPRQMLKVIVYASMRKLYTTRDIERACEENNHFMFLLEGASKPDHSTIARFISIRFAPFAKEIFSYLSNYLHEIGEISGKQIFIDGTKIEAYANKYTFVWKKATTKNLAKLLQKIVDLVVKCELEYGIKIIYQDKVKLKHMKKLRKRLYSIKKQEGIEFVQGKGKRKSSLQKSIEELEHYIEKLKEYTKKLHILGDRNSYSKTDNDATFMRMKDDHMKNGQLKPGYNVQFGVDSEYITWLTVSPKPGDTTTLIPFLNEAEEYLKFKYKNVVTDAGYESEENYINIEKNGQQPFIKPSNYERSKTRKYKKDIGRAENMLYDEGTDSYTCRNSKKLIVAGTREVKSKTGYISIKTKYICEDCSGCPYKKDCIKGNNSKTPLEQRTKRLEISKLYQQKRKESRERITSDFGCELRMNRSIQSEGSFGNTKENMRFRRYHYRGNENVLAETFLLAMGHNINKLHNKIQNDRIGTHLHPMKKTA